MITVVAPAYRSFPILAASLLAQTDRDWEAVIAHDGPWDQWERWMAAFADERIRFRQSRERLGDWGHPLREVILKEECLSGRYILLTNHDNYLTPNAVGKINAQTADVVAFPMVHNYYDYSVLHPKIEFGGIDLSSIAVRADLVKEIGFPWRDNAADFLWVQEVAKRTSDWCFLDECLVVHN